jgi:uncharacterized protein YjbI with pentapeptide repeats
VASESSDLRPARVGAALELIADPEIEDDTEWSEVELTGDLGGRTACDVDVQGSRLVRCVLTGSTFDRMRLTDTVVEDCELSGASFDEASWNRVELRDCRMSGLAVTRAKLRDVRFVRCRLDESSFRMTSGERVVFDECDLRGVDLYDASLAGAALTDCDLTGADLSSANLRGARLHGSTLLDLRGAAALRGVVIDPDQVVPVSYSLLGAFDIVVEDEIADMLEGES